VTRPLSQFLAATLRWLKRETDADCVFSYADPAARNCVTDLRHSGGIYVATNFVFLGRSRVTDTWQTADGEMVTAAQCYRMSVLSGSARVIL
jgi:hypothetical protein